MDAKKFQKAIDILLKQQAATHAAVEMAGEEQKDHDRRLNRIERAAINLYNASVQQGENIDKQRAQIDKQGQQIDKLLAEQKETNGRLNAVIFMAEKFFGGNGKSKPKR